MAAGSTRTRIALARTTTDRSLRQVDPQQAPVCNVVDARGKGQLHRARTIGIHDQDLLGCQPPVEYDLLAIGRECGCQIPYGIVGEPYLVVAVRVHDTNLEGPIAAFPARVDDPCPVRRPRRTSFLFVVE